MRTAARRPPPSFALLDDRPLALLDRSDTTRAAARPGRDEVVPVHVQRPEPPVSSPAACHAFGANVLTSMSRWDAMCTDGRSHVDGSSTR